MKVGVYYIKRSMPPNNTKTPPIRLPKIIPRMPKTNIITPLNPTLVLEDLITPVEIKTKIPTTIAIMALIKTPKLPRKPPSPGIPSEKLKIPKCSINAKTPCIVITRPPMMAKTLANPVFFAMNMIHQKNF